MMSIPNLEALIETIERDRSLSGDPLARLQAASGLRVELDEMSDALLDHFVEAARADGCSWSQIGTALGVSKQAAQQRHTSEQSVARRLLARVGGRGRDVSRIFGGRFSTASRDVVVRAEEEARSLQHEAIGGEHLLLALANVDSLAAEVLRGHGVDYEAARRRIIDLIGQGACEWVDQIPFTPRAKKILELSMGECLQLGSRSIEPEHLLLGMLREGEGLAIQTLRTLGADAATVRAALLDRMQA